MKRAVLEFLKQERDLVAGELRVLREGERRIVHINSGEHDITPQVAAEAEARWLRFEEIIAAYESGVI
jgi:hypothetical protein